MAQEKMACWPESEDNPSDRLTDELCRLAPPGFDAFVDRLDWRVSSDPALLAQVTAGETEASPFHEGDWVRAWLASEKARESTEIRIVAGYLGPMPLIAVPLLVERTGPFRRARFLGQLANDYNHPVLHRGLADLADGEFMRTVWGRVGKMLEGVDLLSLEKQLSDPSSRTRLKGMLRESGENPDHGHWTAVSGDWATAEPRYFGKSTQRSLARKLKKLEEVGPVVQKRVTERPDREAMIEALLGWKRAQFAEMGPLNPFARPAFAAFLRKLGDGDPERFPIFGLYVGDRPVAGALVVRSDTRWLLYQTAYTAEEPGKYSPGMLLLRTILREAHEAGVSAFDFGLGDEGYKDKYCEHLVPLYDADIALTRRGLPLFVLVRVRRRVINMVRSHAGLRQAAMAVLSRLG